MNIECECRKLLEVLDLYNKCHLLLDFYFISFNIILFIYLVCCILHLNACYWFCLLYVIVLTKFVRYVNKQYNRLLKL